MSILILIIQLTVSTTFANTQIPNIQEAWLFDKGGTGKPIKVCPAQNDINESIVEDFLTKSYWSSERAETNTESLTASQITLLTDSNFNSVCSSLNNIYQEALDDEDSIGEKANNVTYYKAGGFYFVVISIRQSDNPNIITTGVNFIDVYDQDLDLIQGYAF